MPSARKRGARSSTPRGPARTPRGTDQGASRSAKASRYGWGFRVARGSGVARGFSRASRAIVLIIVVLAIGGAAILLRGRSAAVDLQAIAGQNVLLITIDTLRADALSAYGGPAATPALDRLATGGVRFPFAHAQTVLTLPSHTTILTGQYPYMHGVRENSGYRLAPGARTIATMLKQAGYATGAFVAAFPLHSRFGLNQGFDVYDDRFGETRDPTEFVMPERPATAVVPLARDWIRGRQAGPWFAWVHVFDPHAPYRPPPPFDREYAAKPYYGEVAATDAALAPLLDDVRSSSRPTIVVVTGDHGEALGDHGEETHGLFAYESTLRVPLIVAEVGGGRRDARGEVSDVAARHIDLLPTLLDAAKQPVPADLPGRSLLEASERGSAAAARPSYFEAMSAMLNRGWAPLTGILSGHDKYIDLPIPELYSLDKDPAEEKNRIGHAPDLERTLAAGLRAFGAALPGARRPEDAEATARLRALGYVSGNAPIKTHYTEADDPKRLVDIDQAVHRGVELYSSGQLDQAEVVYKKVLARRPDMAIAYRHLAFVEWQRGHVNDAIALLRGAIARGVTHIGIATQLGTYLAETGHATEAIALLAPLVDPERGQTNDADALNSLGIAYARAGRADGARRVFERVLTIDAESGIPLENLGVLDLEKGDLASARRRFEAAVAVDPRSSQAHSGLGVVAIRSGDRRAAIESWKEAVRLDRTNFDALYNLATTLLRDGQSDAARPYIEQFVTSAPAAFYEKDIRELSRVLQSQR
jgi:arylsulfatase A-like enzyme/Tfp pilus assembly protein PilF